MATLKELMAQQVALAKQIDEVRQVEHADAIAKVQALIAENGLTKSDIFGSTRGTRKVRAKIGKVAAKYRDPVSGKTWTGRGKVPLWIINQDRTKFLIA